MKIMCVRLLQNKLKSLEKTICWVNEEEALFKFPTTAYPDVGDINTIRERNVLENILKLKNPFHKVPLFASPPPFISRKGFTYIVKDILFTYSFSTGEGKMKAEIEPYARLAIFFCKCENFDSRVCHFK